MQHNEIRSYFKSRIPWYYWIPVIGAMIFAIREFKFYNKQTLNWTDYQLTMIGLMILAGIAYVIMVCGFYYHWW